MAGESDISRWQGPSAWLWIGFVAIASLGLSRAFACATPFVAVAVLAACTLSPRHAMALVLLVWLGNQAIGFGLMDYPHDTSTLAWGAAIWLAALASLGAAWAVRQWRLGAEIVVVAIALIAGYAAYEMVLLAAMIVLPSGPGVFAAAVVLRIFAINAVALGLLQALHHLATAVGLPAGRTMSTRHG